MGAEVRFVRFHDGHSEPLYSKDKRISSGPRTSSPIVIERFIILCVLGWGTRIVVGIPGARLQNSGWPSHPAPNPQSRIAIRSLCFAHFRYRASAAGTTRSLYSFTIMKAHVP